LCLEVRLFDAAFACCLDLIPVDPSKVCVVHSLFAANLRHVMIIHAVLTTPASRRVDEMRELEAYRGPWIHPQEPCIAFGGDRHRVPGEQIDCESWVDSPLRDLLVETPAATVVHDTLPLQGCDEEGARQDTAQAPAIALQAKLLHRLREYRVDAMRAKLHAPRLQTLGRRAGPRSTIVQRTSVMAAAGSLISCILQRVIVMSAAGFWRLLAVASGGNHPQVAAASSIRTSFKLSSSLIRSAAHASVSRFCAC
jgi:hypothetical protein